MVYILSNFLAKYCIKKTYKINYAFQIQYNIQTKHKIIPICNSYCNKNAHHILQGMNSKPKPTGIKIPTAHTFHVGLNVGEVAEGVNGGGVDWEFVSALFGVLAMVHLAAVVQPHLPVAVQPVAAPTDPTAPLALGKQAWVTEIRANNINNLSSAMSGVRLAWGWLQYR